MILWVKLKIFLEDEMNKDTLENSLIYQKIINYMHELEKPYSNEEYREAKQLGLDLDNWNDYVKYFGVGEDPNYDDM